MPVRGREREKRKRQRHRSDSEEDDDSIFTGWKLGLVIGVIVVCFAMLYPTLIHPMLMSLLGRTPPPPPAVPSRPPVHPGMAGPGGPRAGGPSRHDVHPAMRMAQQQAAETQSSGRGSFTWMLPLYTVGVVIFLLYTLFKTKGKKKRRSRYGSSEESSDDDDVYNSRLKKKIGKRKLRSLQERLQQTEEAMSKILEQLEAVQAAGALAEGELPKKAEPSEGKDGEKPEAPTEVNSKNEQYINDLEKALRDFKILSDAYEDEKNIRRRGSHHSGSEEDETSSEELNSASDEDEDEDEEEEEQATKSSNKKEKITKESEEDDNDVSEEESPKEDRSKPKIDLTKEETVPAESTIESKETKKSAKQLRRRPKKV